MTDALAEVREFFRNANVPLAPNDVWSVQGTPVVKHKALERLAAALKIKFEHPQFLRTEREEAVIFVAGHCGEDYEWSIGEACVGVNYRVSPKVAAYPYAMAEKRAKDRVILKLANLRGVYSEDEADEFRRYEETPPLGGISTSVTQEQLKNLVVEIGRTGRSIEKLLKHYGVERIQDLTSRNAADAVEMLSGLPDKPKAA